MATFIHGIAASENIDTSGERLSIAGMDISSLDKDGVFNWEHKADQPAQVVGKILKAKKIFTEQDCEDDHQLYFWQKCQTPYVYVMGELMDDYKESAKEVAGHFRYEADRDHEASTVNFSIEGGKMEKKGMDVLRSVARKVTITVLACNKATVAEMVTIEKRPKKGDINELFKTENVEAELFKGETTVLAKMQPKLTLAKPAAIAAIGATKSGKAISANARIHEYKDFNEQDHRDAATTHLSMAAKLGPTDFKQAQHHRNKGLLHNSAANTLMDRAARLTPPKPKGVIGQPNMRNSKQLFDPDLSSTKFNSPIKKALEAGSALAAPSQLVGGAALVSETLVTKKKKKSNWLARAEQEYEKWQKRENYESFMSTRMPHLTKGEIKAIGQVMVLNKSMTLEKALANLSGYEPMEKSGGKNSIYTLILFEGCELHDILHCSHFATDAMNEDTYEKIKEVCDKYFEKGLEAKELEFKESGELGKQNQKVLFLTDGDPYKDLFEQLDKAAPYKYSKFRPHISVTSNVDEFKGKAASLVISVNGEVKNKYDFK